MANFLLEIGVEELPSRFLAPAQASLVESFGQALAAEGLDHGSIASFATPRRLGLEIRDVAPRQVKKEEIVMGPPAKGAYLPDGVPSKALEGFLRTQNISLDDVFTTKAKKGEYIAAKIHTGGKSALELLSAIIPDMISTIPFAKRMRWGSHDIAFGRPLRWILALLGSDIVPFKYGHVQAGRSTFGHRVHGHGPFEVASADDYARVAAENCLVETDPAKRREVIIARADAAATALGGEVIWRDDLLDEVTGLIEHPVPIIGEFSRDYLEIPEEVLLTSMQSHQKSFGLRGKDGKLLPNFVTVLNLDPENVDLVRHGWERVLRARLEDARFFWTVDRGQALEDWLAKLDNVIFIGPLGSMGDKGRRLEKLCGWLANQIEPGMIGNAERAGKLAKADLVSGMVGEFDTLQGIMGGIYASEAGEDKGVAGAIGEQYLPAGPDSPLPHTLLGSILSVADKADTLAGCFGLNMIPSGAADPNGLRRCVLGIIRIFLDRRIEIPVSELFGKALDLYGQKNWKHSREETLEKLRSFFAGRLRNYFLSKGYNTILVDAVLAAGFERVSDCRYRLDALAAFGSSSGYIGAARTLKRAENISRKQDIRHQDSIWKEELLTDPAEKNLDKELKKILPRLDSLLEKGEYAAVLDSLGELRPFVDKFFDEVMVLCEDADLRANRLAMLGAISRRYARVARFASLQI